MDIVQKTYAPSLRQSSAETLFKGTSCENTLDYVLIGLIIILCLLIVTYYMRRRKDETKKEFQSSTTL